ncbi:MAG: Sensor histidine kinase RcsC [Anaerolineae bacterium]|nr:Sensor histidine kinase RcsC [Anaerolineae bacterium]
MKDDTLLLLDTLKIIHACRDSAALLRLVVARSLTLVDGERGCLLIATNGQLRYQVGLDQAGAEIAEADFPLSQTVVNAVTESRRPLVAPDTNGDAALRRRPSIVHSKIRMVLCVPLAGRDETPVGLLYVSSETPAGQTQLSERRLEILAALAGQAAVALEQTRLVERLWVLDAAKSDFIAIVSHEMRTPVALMRGYADILAGQSLPPLARQIAAELRHSAGRLTGIVNLMLDATQVSQATLTLTLRPYSLRALVRQVAARWQPAAADRQLGLMVELPADDPVEAAIDAPYFETALDHLLQNAIKFTPDGGQIVVSLENRKPGVRIVVTDTGIGIAPEHRELVFEKFWRAGDSRLHSTGQTKFMGAGPGLGLYLARGIVEAHGGRLWVASEGEGQGSRFGVELGG